MFSSVHFREILPTELPWENNIKQSKKKRWHVIFINGITDGITNGKFRR
jgi:hypothetical protein